LKHGQAYTSRQTQAPQGAHPHDPAAQRRPYASHEAAAIDALFDAFAHNLARKLAARAERTGGSQPRKPRGETR
jgi:hypothetical protein